VLLGFVGFFSYLHTGYTGPWTSKWDLPPKTKERMKGVVPEFDSLFTPDTHPLLKGLKALDEDD